MTKPIGIETIVYKMMMLLTTKYFKVEVMFTSTALELRIYHIYQTVVTLPTITTYFDHQENNIHSLP